MELGCVLLRGAGIEELRVLFILHHQNRWADAVQHPTQSVLVAGEVAWRGGGLTPAVGPHSQDKL